MMCSGMFNCVFVSSSLFVFVDMVMNWLLLLMMVDSIGNVVLFVCVMVSNMCCVVLMVNLIWFIEL